MNRPAAVLAVVIDLALGVAGVLAGFAPSSAEPNNEFVPCGPALFGRPDPMPDPACADSYAPFDTLSVVLLMAATAALIIAAVIWFRTRKNPSPRRTSSTGGAGRTTPKTAYETRSGGRNVDRRSPNYRSRDK